MKFINKTGWFLMLEERLDHFFTLPKFFLAEMNPLSTRRLVGLVKKTREKRRDTTSDLWLDG
jgi:hypothetical protein